MFRVTGDSHSSCSGSYKGAGVSSYSSIKPSTARVAETCFDPAQIPESLHLDVWRQASTAGAKVDSLDPHWRFLGKTRNWYTEGLVFSHTQCSATRYQRTSQHTRHGDTDCIVLKLQLTGAQQGQFGDFDHFTSPTGSLVLQDWALPYTIVTTPYEVFSVAISRHLLRGSHLLYRRNPVITWAADSPQARLLAPTLRHAFENLENASQEEADTYAAGITGLLDGLLTGDRGLLQQKYHERDRFESMRRYLVQNLADPKLAVDHLCRHFHCSRATVYRLFQQEGGVASFILRQRLQRCMQELGRMGTAHRGFFDALAQSWGFSSRASFARQFKAHYGISPQQAMEASRISGRQGQLEPGAIYWRDAHRVSQWLTKMHLRAKTRQSGDTSTTTT